MEATKNKIRIQGIIHMHYLECGYLIDSVNWLTENSGFCFGQWSYQSSLPSTRLHNGLELVFENERDGNFELSLARAMYELSADLDP